MDSFNATIGRFYEWHSEVDESVTENSLDETKEEKRCLPSIDRNLIHCKLFYFCYSSAMGSLWPYVPLYFRQLFLTPRQVGAIVAARTIVQFLFVPFWCMIAEKYRKHKELLLVSLFAWLISTVGILFIPREEPRACLTMRNLTKKQIEKAAGKEWFDFSPFKDSNAFLISRDESREYTREHRDLRDQGVFDDYIPALILNTSSDFAAIYEEYDPEKHLSDSSRPFILLLLVTILGVSLASPAQTLADICTLKRLKHQAQSFGQQVVWAAVGSALFAFTIGVSVNFLQRRNPCTRMTEVNYSPCFYAFTFFMLLAFIVATQFKFQSNDAIQVDLDETIANLWECVKTINDVHLTSLLVVTFSCGFGNGFISTFLFWHLQEMGGLQILLAFVSLINSTAEVLFYMLSDRLLGYVGHFRLIYLGLFFFSARFFYYSFLRQPWLVLPIEITHGMTSAAIRSAMISYIRQEGTTGHILHGIFNGIHGGLGFSVGGLVGGFMVHNYGHAITFLIFGEISLLTLFCFVLINNIWPYTKHDMKDMFERQTTKNKLAELYNVNMKSKQEQTMNHNPNSHIYKFEP